jgi:hypothetical protein
MRLTRRECKVVADDDAYRWRVLLAVDPDDAFGAVPRVYLVRGHASSTVRRAKLIAPATDQ